MIPYMLPAPDPRLADLLEQQKYGAVLVLFLISLVGTLLGFILKGQASAIKSNGGKIDVMTGEIQAMREEAIASEGRGIAAAMELVVKSTKATVTQTEKVVQMSGTLQEVKALVLKCGR